MCLIIQKPANVPIPFDLLESAFNHNRDGWGVMWAKDGAIQTVKGFDMASLVEATDSPEFAEKDGFVHLRIGTAGKVNLDNCHPFKVNDNIYLMHNGILGVTQSVSKDMSDTWHFVRNYVEPVLSKYPDAFMNEDWITDMEYFIGSGNKLALMNSNGDFSLVNRRAWTRYEGLMLSNVYSCPIKYRYKDYTPGKTYHQHVLANAGQSHGTSGPKAVGSSAENGGNSASQGSPSSASCPAALPAIVVVNRLPSDSEEIDRLVRQQFAQQGIVDETEELENDGWEMVEDDDEDYTEMLAEGDSPKTLGDLVEMPYEDLEMFILQEPDAVAAIIWRADYRKSAYSMTDVQTVDVPCNVPLLN